MWEILKEWDDLLYDGMEIELIFYHKMNLHLAVYYVYSCKKILDCLQEIIFTELCSILEKLVFSYQGSWAQVAKVPPLPPFHIWF